MRVGELVKDELKARNMTQTYVAKKIGIHRHHLSEKINGIRNARLDKDTLDRIADVTG